jgi:SAM-dependent methyltransferase
MRTRREEGVECCYAKQTKFWAHDPDGNLWEVYTFDGDIDHRGAGQAQEAVLSLGGCAASTPAAVYEHRMTDPVPVRIPLEDGAADEVRLRGTFNLPLSANERAALVSEAARVLKPGGRLFVHVLTGESPVENPELPGPAGKVQSVPFEADPVALLESAGFVGVRMLKFDNKPCFVRSGVGMRELQLEGFAPLASCHESVDVMYKGPFRELLDDEGRVFARGRRVAVPPAVAERLRAGELAAQFTVFESIATRPAVVTSCAT